MLLSQQIARFSTGVLTMTTPHNPERREALKTLLTGGAAFATGAAFGSYEERILATQLAEENQGTDVKDVEPDALSGASRTHTNWAKFADLKRPMEKGTLKKLRISKMIMGGNLIGGWAHARDMIYASELVVAYHTRDKIIATFKLGEACGINAYLGHHSHIGIMTDYWEKANGTMHYIADCGSLDDALRCAEKGAAAVYIQGGVNDRLVKAEKFDEIAAFVERFKKDGVRVGLGGHLIETIKGCVEKGIEPDFWLKTIHHGNYRSAPADRDDFFSVFDRTPDETIAYMNTLTQPWIGFKVLAAGAIHPTSGFRYAFEGGADFICVGIYDFQVVDDVNICMDILRSDIKRKRPWCYT